jgi:predicted Zn-dependent protease
VRQKAQSRPHFYFTRRTLRLSCILLLLLFAFFPTFRHTVVRSGVGLISTEHEIDLGDRLFRSMATRPNFVVDPVITNAVDEITEKLVVALPEEDRRFTYHVHVMQDPEVNAFALPGGHIVVNTGLLDQALNAEEVAGAIGHEMGHVSHRHALSNLVETLGAYALVHMILGRGHDRAEGLGVALMHLEFSREQESEADEASLHTLRRAGMDVAPFIAFFDRLAKDEGRQPDLLTLLRTHPAPQDRVANLKRLAAEPCPAVAPAKFSFDFKDVQSHVKGLPPLPDPKKEQKKK